MRPPHFGQHIRKRPPLNHLLLRCREFGVVAWFLITRQIIQSGLGDRLSGSHWWHRFLLRVSVPIAHFNLIPERKRVPGFCGIPLV